jgi:hypothetical protein
MCILINFTDFKVNDYVSLQWPWENSNSWPLKSKLKTWPVELTLVVIRFFFFIINMNVRTSLHAPQLISHDHVVILFLIAPVVSSKTALYLSVFFFFCDKHCWVIYMVWTGYDVSILQKVLEWIHVLFAARI